MQSLDDVFEQSKNDPTLFSTIDVDGLLEKIETAHYLENKGITDISKEVFDAIDELHLDKDVALDYCMRLTGYRVVDKICDLRNGILLRWIKKSGGSLTNGGILVNVKMDQKGVQLMCKNNVHRFFNVRFDDCLIFQKLTMEEQLVLSAFDSDTFRIL
jgi:hypothetical protein